MNKLSILATPLLLLLTASSSSTCTVAVSVDTFPPERTDRIGGEYVGRFSIRIHNDAADAGTADGEVTLLLTDGRYQAETGGAGAARHLSGMYRVEGDTIVMTSHERSAPGDRMLSLDGLFDYSTTHDELTLTQINDDIRDLEIHLWRPGEFSR